MKKRILCVILSLAAVFSLIGFNATEAWFSDGKNKSMVLKSGNFNFTATGGLEFQIPEEKKYLPGDTITLTDSTSGVKIINSSNIETELRIKIDCENTKTNEKGEPVIGEDGKFVKEKNEWIEFSLSGTDAVDYWDVVTEDGIIYLYYCPDGDASNDNENPDYKPDYRIDAVPEEEKMEIELNSNLIVSGEVPIDMTNKSMNFTVTLQAKQADFMEWSEFTPVEENGNQA